jgi:tRNA(adenine34) deaminase
MCAGAILNARLRRVVFGASDPKAGSLTSVQRMFDLPYNHKPQIDGGFMQEECAAVLRDFFADMRRGVSKAPLNPNWIKRSEQHAE